MKDDLASHTSLRTRMQVIAAAYYPGKNAEPVAGLEAQIHAQYIQQTLHDAPWPRKGSSGAILRV